jgi:FMN phosphatase YigB (HAD superfamily)
MVYAVGDNIASDIAGANHRGWRSILVRTGVFKDDNNGADVAQGSRFAMRPQHHIPPDFLKLASFDVAPLLEPTVLCDDIGEAVDYILLQESLM